MLPQPVRARLGRHLVQLRGRPLTDLRHRATGGRHVRDAVDQYELAERTVRRERVDGNRLQQAHPHARQDVLLEALHRMLRAGVDVDGELHLFDHAGDQLGSQLDQIVPARHERGVIHPQDRRLEAVGHGYIGPGGEHAAARHVDLAVERDGDRAPHAGGIPRRVAHEDALDAGALPAGKHDELIARMHLPRLDLPLEPTERTIGAAHALHGHIEPLLDLSVGDIDLLELGEQRLAAVPLRMQGGPRHVIALSR